MARSKKPAPRPENDRPRAELLHSPHLRDLEVLTVYDEDISEAGYRMVREKFGEGPRE
jgi:hypothetical protein